MIRLDLSTTKILVGLLKPLAVLTGNVLLSRAEENHALFQLAHFEGSSTPSLGDFLFRLQGGGLVSTLLLHSSSPQANPLQAKPVLRKKLRSNKSLYMGGLCIGSQPIINNLAALLLYYAKTTLAYLLETSPCSIVLFFLFFVLSGRSRTDPFHMHFVGISSLNILERIPNAVVRAPNRLDFLYKWGKEG